MFRIVGKLLHPIAQLRHMHAQVLRSLHIGHASLLDQAHSLKLELAGKLPSLHDTPPAPSKHLTRCLRNRVQAKRDEQYVQVTFGYVQEHILARGIFAPHGEFDAVSCRAPPPDQTYNSPQRTTTVQPPWLRCRID